MNEWGVEGFCYWRRSSARNEDLTKPHHLDYSLLLFFVLKEETLFFSPNFVMVCIGILMSGNLVFVGGKSAILTALCVAFGCRAKGTQRAATLKDFIKTGCRFV